MKTYRELVLENESLNEGKTNHFVLIHYNENDKKFTLTAGQEDEDSDQFIGMNIFVNSSQFLQKNLLNKSIKDLKTFMVFCKDMDKERIKIVKIENTSDEIDVPVKTLKTWNDVYKFLEKSV